MLLCFDDTDGPTGGCTTHALFAVLGNLPDLAPKGMPRLVRLNPNVPWKTRGNGAVCIELVRPTGAHVVVGEWQGMEMRAYPDGDPMEPDEAVLDAAWDAIGALTQEDAKPAVMVLDDAPSPLHYWQAVRTIMAPHDAVTYARTAGVLHRATGDGRALIGCLAAAAWPGPATSYEFIAYRRPSHWGTPRRVEEGALRGLDATGITFHTEDPDDGVLCCVPHTPCPVLLGLRGTDPERLLQTARSTVPLAAEEPIDGWILWASNQASGDHVSPVDSVQEADHGMTIRLDGVVADRPEDRKGGHVRIMLKDARGTPFVAMAFEPTKSFRDVVRRLRPRDQVAVTGGFADGTVRLEKVEVLDAAPAKSANPVCPSCHRSMKSRGAGEGYKCPACGKTTTEAAATFHDRSGLLGVHEVPVVARRHLHRPAAWAPLSAPASEVAP